MPPTRVLPRPSDLPDWPLGYRWLRAHGLKGLTPWYFVDDVEVIASLRREFLREIAPPHPCPVRDLVPFCRRQDNDDVAGFVWCDGRYTGEVAYVHLTWSGRRESPGFPDVATYGDIFSFLRDRVLPDSAAWMDEQELDAVLDEGEGT